MRRAVLGSALAVLVGSVLVAACALGTEPSGLVRELDALGATLSQAMVDENSEALLVHYADDAVMLAPNEAKLVGKQAIRENMLASRKSGTDIQSFSGRVEQAWECGGMVYAVGSYAASVAVPGVERPIGDKGKFMSVYRRESDGTLKVLYDMWNSDVPPGK
jgi:ketosteroid isomerase-like protein